MADTKHDVGVVTDAALAGDNILQPTYTNIGSQLLLTNHNGASLVHGDVAVLSTANAESAVQAVSTGPCRPAFVVPKDIDTNGAEISKTVLDTEAGWMYKPGAFVPDAAVDGAVTRGEYLGYSATAKKFTGMNVFTRRPLKAQAIALASIAVAGNIPILLLAPSPQVAKAARVFNSADIARAGAAEHLITFDSETFDDYGFHEGITNPGRLTVPADQYGVAMYLITGQVTWASTNGHSLGIKVNGTFIAGTYHGGSIGQQVEARIRLNATDYVELWDYSGAGETIKYYANYSPVFSIMQIGE